jgi:hypothetical protein
LANPKIYAARTVLVKASSIAAALLGAMPVAAPKEAVLTAICWFSPEMTASGDPATTAAL